MNLTFTPTEDDILNATIQDSDTDSALYIVGTPKRAGGTLTTTVTRRNRLDGSTRFAFRILWKGVKGSLEDVDVVLDSGTSREVPVREVLGNAPGITT